MNIPGNRGQSLVLALATIPITIVALALVYLAFCEARKFYWDYQVDRMCEKDGGVHVFEQVTLSRSRDANLFGPTGLVSIPPDIIATPNHAYFTKHSMDVLREKKPSVRRHETLFLRRSDNGIIAKQVSYGRRGGDFPIGIGDGSSYLCPSVDEDHKLVQSMFIVKE